MTWSETRECVNCGPGSEFSCYVVKSGVNEGKTAKWCKACQKRWRDANREHINAYTRQCRADPIMGPKMRAYTRRYARRPGVRKKRNAYRRKRARAVLGRSCRWCPATDATVAWSPVRDECPACCRRAVRNRRWACCREPIRRTRQNRRTFVLRHRCGHQPICTLCGVDEIGFERGLSPYCSKCPDRAKARRRLRQARRRWRKQPVPRGRSRRSGRWAA